MQDANLIAYIPPDSDRVLFRELDTDDSLTQLQQLTGGLVDVVAPPGADLDAWVNDEGLLVGLDRNMLAEAVLATEGTEPLRQPLVGTVVLTRSDDEGDTIPLTAEQLERLREYRQVMPGLIRVPATLVGANADA